MAITMTTLKVRRRTCRAVRKGPGTRREQSMGRGKGRGKGRRREMVKGEVLLNKRKGEMISFVPLFGSYRRNCIRQTRTQRAN